MDHAIQIAEKNRFQASNEMKPTHSEGLTMNRIMLLKTMNGIANIRNTLKIHGDILKSLNEKIGNN